MSYREEHYFKPNHANHISESGQQGVDFLNYSSEDLVKLWRETLKKGMHGICFSMYEDGQKPGDTITEEQVERRIKILKHYAKWIRSFSCIEGNENIPRIAKKHGMKNLVGAWLGDDMEKNEQEIEGLIQLAKEGCVDIAAVGNEVLYRKDLTEQQLLDYILRVKEALRGMNIPVGYVDAYYEFSHRPAITEVCDVILSNCYPYWEGCSIDYSLAHMQQMFSIASHAGQGKKVIITETGWPSQGGSLGGAHSNAENAMKYFINAQAWSAKDNIEMFYFSSFDESWKVGAEGDVGAYWGLWDKNENLKF
ncbi:MAG: glycosyl hydrolase [Flavobacteriia bacterium]|nr:glycosyl hydrolase [Flavobacteriia bacterium]OIP46157.1 MAG: glycosyl hydrolase [Flavobacteriaceae bacterium CG2_30_31_66]PIV96960.1 MAG: glycosyl hydrolase [Flavobacteriaceae bacterium CG17_big_fil_post_rev_8_21_14_2_50_31_13]PIX11276.1 MAG: glycosyl hydrolase [Flavobacteriaceae bacterium CG_4_8_14_3_um_filter_31_8]PIY15266.1 MAG: glycosyl hydrolase [Flavobacteriaceae bacterium CG_4_10_14_3_um_filter_31_253]PIZ12018.1 MAG: glycosyl hydrolase [Flavobacteriaceae bacterium CG_4_10_14_0_8_um_f